MTASVLATFGWGALAIIEIDIQVSQMQNLVVLQASFFSTDVVLVVDIGIGLACDIRVPISLSDSSQVRLEWLMYHWKRAHLRNCATKEALVKDSQKNVLRSEVHVCLYIAHAGFAIVRPEAAHV